MSRSNLPGANLDPQSVALLMAQEQAQHRAEDRYNEAVLRFMVECAGIEYSAAVAKNMAIRKEAAENGTPLGPEDETRIKINLHRCYQVAVSAAMIFCAGQGIGKFEAVPQKAKLATPGDVE